VLKDDVSLQDAVDLIYRRETRKDDASAARYSRPARLTADSVLIEKLENFEGVASVLYVRLAKTFTLRLQSYWLG